MKDYLPSLIIAALAGVILWKLWPQLTAKAPSVDELAGAIAAANAKAAADPKRPQTKPLPLPPKNETLPDLFRTYRGRDRNFLLWTGIREGPERRTQVVKLLLLTLAVLLTGCTVFKVKQRDESVGERTITTTVTGIAWFSSAQAITKLKATTTDKTQTIGTDAIGQHGATNSVVALQAVIRILELLRPTP